MKLFINEKRKKEDKKESKKKKRELLLINKGVFFLFVDWILALKEIWV